MRGNRDELMCQGKAMIWTRNGYAPSLDAKKRHCMAPPGQGKEQLCSGKEKIFLGLAKNCTAKATHGPEAS